MGQYGPSHSGTSYNSPTASGSKLGFGRLVDRRGSLVASSFLTMTLTGKKKAFTHGFGTMVRSMETLVSRGFRGRRAG